jgi:hypothetical protein
MRKNSIPCGESIRKKKHMLNARAIPLAYAKTFQHSHAKFLLL